MKFKQFPDRILNWISERDKLRSALIRNAEGTPSTPRSWFYEHKSPKWILDSIRTKLYDMGKSYPRILKFEESKVKVFGAQGECAPLSKRLDGFSEYFAHLEKPVITSKRTWQIAKRNVVQRLNFKQSASPLTAEKVIELGLAENKYDTSSGAPLYEKRKSPEALEHAKVHYKDAIKERYPFTLGQRGSMGKTKDAARNIFMASMDVNVCGQRFQRALQDHIRSLKLDFFTPWEGWDAVQLQISRNWQDGVLKFGADYTKMDQHFNIYHGLECYDVIKEYFKPEFWDELKSIIQYVFSSPIITGMGYIDENHSMPSGSEWTNFLETIWNYIFCEYLRITYGIKFRMISGIGDDQLWLVEGEWNSKTIKALVDLVIKQFELAGLPGNPDKQEVSLDETTYLQRFLDSSWRGENGQTLGAGVYSLIRNVTSQTFPEFTIRLKKGDPAWADLFPIRVIQIAENTTEHPLYKWYIQEFVAKSNKNILEFVRKKVDEVENLYQFSKTKPHLVPNYVGKNKENTPLSEFATFKLLRALV